MKELETNRLLLRKWKTNDDSDVYEYAKNPLVGPSAGWKPHASIEESRNIMNLFIKENDVLAIELKSENKVIGSIGLHDRKPDANLTHLPQREIGFVVNPEYWGKGIAPEATGELIRFGFEEMGLHLIWCMHFEENIKSKRVIDKCGFNFKFKKETTLPLLNGKKVNTLYYNISKSEYFKENQRK